MKIKFIKDTVGIYGREFKKGFVKEYFPWNFEWQEKKEQERVENGIFVECLGHGEFNVFTKNDVIVQES